MAAQPNPWGVLVDYATPASTPTLDPQKYRQSEPKRPTLFFDSSILTAEPGIDWAEFEFLKPSRAVSEAVESDSLTTILASIDHVFSANVSDSDVAATERAYRSARAVVESAYGRLRARVKPTARVPVPTVTTDDTGGVRLSWQHGDRHVRTRFGAVEGMRSYLYFESPTEHAVELLKPSVLSDKLEWMLKP